MRLPFERSEQRCTGHLWSYIGVVLLSLLFLGGPALIKGPVFGPVDLLNYPAVDHYLFSDVLPEHINNTMLSDQLDFVMPYYHLVREALKRGELPLWNRYNGNGVPLLPNIQSGVFSPQVLISLLVPERYAYLLQVFFNLLILGTGLVFFFQVMEVSPLASLIGAVSFQFSGPVVVWLGWPHLRVICWIGWVLGFSALAIKGKRPLLASGALGAVLGLQFLGGHPQSTLMVAVAMLLFLPSLLWLWWRNSKKVGNLLFPALGVLLGVMVGMVQYLPALPLIHQSFMKTARSSKALVTGTPLSYLKLYLFPYLWGNWRCFAGPPNYLELTSYVGILPVLAPLAFLRRFNPLVLFGLLLTAFSFLVAFHTPVLPNLGPLGILGTPHRFVMLLNLGLVVLVAAALDSVERWESFRFKTVLSTLMVVLLIASSAYGLHLLFHVAPVSPTVARLRLWSILAWTIPVSILAVFSVVMLWRGVSKRLLGATLALQVIWLFGYGITFNTFGKVLFPESPVISSVKRRVGEARTSWIAPAQFWPNTNIPYKVSVLSVHESLIPTSWVGLLHFLEPDKVSKIQLTPSFVKTSVFLNPDTYRIFGVEHLVVPEGKDIPPDLGGLLEREYSSPSLSVYRVKGVSNYDVPVRCITENSLSAEEKQEGLVNGLGSGALAIVEDKGAFLCENLSIERRKCSDPSFEILEHRWINNYRELVKVKLNCPGLLVRRVLNSPGWQVTIDQKNRRIYRVNVAFQGVWLEKGAHELVFTYWPRFFTLSLLVGGVGGLGLIVMVIAGLFERERETIDV